MLDLKVKDRCKVARRAIERLSKINAEVWEHLDDIGKRQHCGRQVVKAYDLQIDKVFEVLKLSSVDFFYYIEDCIRQEAPFYPGDYPPAFDIHIECGGLFHRMEKRS